MHKILYFHHADKLGGAPLSLLYLLQKLDPTCYGPLVCCLKSGEVASHFRQQNIPTIVCEGITTFGHTTGGWYPLYSPLSLWRLIEDLFRFPFSVWRTYRLVKELEPALVHLNSLTLVPSAIGVKLAGIPMIWHVREMVHEGHFGIRRRLLRWLIQRLPDEVIYISQDTQCQLASPKQGQVIYNFVDFRRFDRNLSKLSTRKLLGVPSTSRVALFLGGVSLIKGAFPLAVALPLVKEQMPDFICLVAGHTRVGVSHSLGSLWRRLRTALGRPTNVQKTQAQFTALASEGWVRLLGFRTDVEQLLAASDVLIFPATVPHFARPIVEAGAMAKPVVASKLMGIEEIVHHEQTGFLVPPNDPEALADRIIAVLADDKLATSFGERGYQQAQILFDADQNIRQVIAIYAQLLGEHYESA